MKQLELLKKYRAMKDKELVAELIGLKNNCVKTSLKVGAGKEKNYSLVSKLKKDIARIQTVILEKKYGANNE